MAPRTIDKTVWHLDFGSSDCELCGPSWDRLEVEYHTGTKLVDIHYEVGCTGGDDREGVPLEEAIEWVHDTKELWSEYGPRIATIAQGLERYRD